MKKTIKYLLLFLVSASLIGFIAWKYINKPNEDLSQKNPEVIYDLDTLIKKVDNDTAALNKIIDQFAAVKGIIKKINKDSSSVTVELGDTTSMSGVICQIDSRHQSSCRSLKEGEMVCIKGKITSFSLDTILGLGNSIEMNFCSLHK